MGFGSSGASRSKQVRGRSEALKRRLASAGRSVGTAPDFADCPGMLAAITAVVDYGAAITLSRTSDGGAAVVAVIDNGDVSKHYARDIEELTAIVAALIDVYAAPEKAP